MLAARYLKMRRSVLSNVSRLAFFGLVLSVAVLVVVLSIVNGFERELKQRVLAVLPHLTVHSSSGLTLQALQNVRPAPENGLAGLAPVVHGTVLLAAHGEIVGTNLTGIDPESYPNVSAIGNFLANGPLTALGDEKFGIIVGAALAAELGVVQGDTLLVILPNGSVTPAGVIPRQKRFKVIDLFRSQSQLDGQSAYISLSTAQKLFRTGGTVHGAHGRLNNLFESSAAETYLFDMLGQQSVRIDSWMSTYNGSLYQAIAVQKLTMFVLLSFLVGVAAFNLVSGLMMIVEQRKHDIAVLRTLGARSSLLMGLFSSLGLVVALLGVICGLAAGIAIAWGLPALFGILNERFELALMSQYFIAYLPVDVRVADLVKIGGASLLLAGIATLYPAWRATQLLPSRVLAHE